MDNGKKLWHQKLRAEYNMTELENLNRKEKEQEQEQLIQ